MSREDREVLWAAFFAGLIAAGIVCAIWLAVQVVNQLDIQLS